MSREFNAASRFYNVSSWDEWTFECLSTVVVLNSKISRFITWHQGRRTFRNPRTISGFQGGGLSPKFCIASSPPAPWVRRLCLPPHDLVKLQVERLTSVFCYLIRLTYPEILVLMFRRNLFTGTVPSCNTSNE